MTIKMYTVDAFTDQPFKGNPAAVLVLDEPLDDHLMQDIAVEINLSETAFILMRKGQNPLLRWFMPSAEIDLCGHATLASAHVYLTEIYPSLDEVTFETKVAGPLKIIRKGPSRYMMDFPSRAGDKADIEKIPKFVLDALTEARPIEAYQARDLMLIYDDEDIVRSMKPDFKALAQFERFIIVTAPSKKYDFISRFFFFFSPEAGVVEDPVTGSAHCTLAPYWARILDKNRLFAYQASRRGGELTLDVLQNRVYMTGSAVTIMDGTVRMEALK